MAEPNPIDYTALRRRLSEQGSCVWTDKEGKRLVFVASWHLDMEETGLLIAYEGEGSIFFEGDHPLNVFRLLAAGFSATIASTLADVINNLCFPVGKLEALEPRLLLPRERVKEETQ